MKGVDFPITKTKTDGIDKKFNLNDPAERKEYFQAKAGAEIATIKKYLGEGKTFVGYLLGKKNSGKGTYSKMFMEAVGGGISHVAVGDIVRDVHAAISDSAQKEALAEFLKKNYRGFHSIDEVFDLIEGRSQSTLISTELILALLKYEISKHPKQSVFIDGFPRGLDQINYSIFLKDLLGYRDDPDFFVFIDLPESIIDERIKFRVICPRCKTSRSMKLLVTKDIGYDEATGGYYLMCDDPACDHARMVPKEGDELGIEPIRKRLETDEEIFKQLLNLQGVPKVYLRNSLPVDKTAEYVDDYEVTPEYGFEKDAVTGQVKTTEKPWTIKDDNGVESNSLLAAPVVLSMIKQIAKILE